MNFKEFLRCNKISIKRLNSIHSRRPPLSNSILLLVVSAFSLHLQKKKSHHRVSFSKAHRKPINHKKGKLHLIWPEATSKDPVARTHTQTLPQVNIFKTLYKCPRHRPLRPGRNVVLVVHPSWRSEVCESPTPITKCFILPTFVLRTNHAVDDDDDDDSRLRPLKKAPTWLRWATRIGQISSAAPPREFMKDSRIFFSFLRFSLSLTEKTPPGKRL